MNTPTLETLRADELTAGKRCGDLRRWRRLWGPEGEDYYSGIGEGLGIAATFVLTGKFGPLELCRHLVALVSCKVCNRPPELEENEGEQLEAIAAIRRQRLEELGRWIRAYEQSRGDRSKGIAKGLELARVYIRRGDFGLPEPSVEPEDTRSLHRGARFFAAALAVSELETAEAVGQLAEFGRKVRAG